MELYEIKKQREIQAMAYEKERQEWEKQRQEREKEAHMWAKAKHEWESQRFQWDLTKQSTVIFEVDNPGQFVFPTNNNK